MKTIIFLCFSLFFLNYTFLYGQSKVKKSSDVILVFDYSTKLWKYENSSGKELPYFVLKNKSQPIIQVIKLPSSSTKIEIEEQYYDVTPEVKEQKEKDPKMAPLTEDDGHKITQTMGMIDSDEVIYKVTVKNAVDTVLHTTEVFAKVYGRLKIDLSTGVLFHTLQDESYFFSDAVNNQSSIIRDASKGKIRPLFPVVMTHIYKQSTGNLSPGFSLGLGIDDSGKAGFYLGGALIFGDRQRAILSAGWALRPADKLKGKYEVGQKISSEDLPETIDLVESNYRSGYFFSLTYNLTSNVSKR